MREKLHALQSEALEMIERVTKLDDLKGIRVKFLGKKGPITEVMRGLGQLSPEERPLMGQLVNEVREKIQAVMEEKQAALEAKQLEEQLASEQIDVTLPGRTVPVGSIHPLTRTIQTIEDIFIGLGFEVAEGPEVEMDHYNFEMLNLPKEHPARDMQDSFYITEETLLRTHTSPVQVRTLLAKAGQVPVKIICPGKVYRRDDDDATHSHQFTQIEGLVVDEGIRMSDLKGILLEFAKEMFGADQKIRLRPSFFPFTEPSTEVDISCMICKGEGCRVCKETGWIEILGAGMVHPNVLRGAGYDPERYTGFAFGMGVERVAMLKHGVEDIRNFYTNDLRFLRQFSHL
ncbi:phenylalanine--tRNA ligase subunit alpha [Rubeoparvulum massiliense]|uniref:phenylalanine--tRNA ligase subunit alpha n=1 Tax=Rubeoparvulum massiliense TaxID=1631346 RepID=UPI00065E42ED|nr:phenylalanine--tRNA ligase subunit alpha [Rubeoparvulum massiliense]